MNKESLNTTTQLIKLLLPDFEEFLSDVKSGHGYFSLPPPIIELLSRDGLPPWATFYEDPARIKSLAAHAFIGPENIDEFRRLTESLTSAEQLEFKDEIKNEALRFELSELSNDDFDFPTQEEAEKQWNEMTEEEKLITEKRLYLFLFTLITQVSYYLAIRKQIGHPQISQHTNQVF